MSEAFDKIINTELFEVSVPEVYNKCIPKYFTHPCEGDLPRINGERVSWEEYAEQHPDFQRDEVFTPDMIYAPAEMNEATSMEPVASMVDYIDNNIGFSIANPDVAYPRILEILNGYSLAAGRYASAVPELGRYMEKVANAIETIEFAYKTYQSRKNLKVTGKLDDGLTAFDRIEKRFN